MTIFRVPGDFPSISLALDSPLVQRGDTLMVKDRDYNRMVIVPFDKVGILVTGNDGKSTDAIEKSEPGNQVAGTGPTVSAPFAGVSLKPDNDKDVNGQSDDNPSGPFVEAGASLGPSAARPGVAPKLEPLCPKAVVPAARASVKMIKVEQGSVSPYWMIVRRCTLERCRP